jgi:REP element-mobilizing transposase RayT
LMPKPLAYFISWGTYGTRLHGDPRGTVDRDHNERGTPVLGFDPIRWEREKGLLKFPPVFFTREQMRFAESVIPEICERGHWNYLTCAAGPDHVHAVLDFPFDPKAVRGLLKRWLGQELSNQWRLPAGATWWAESGSIRWAYEQDYLRNILNYVNGQCASE